MNYMLKEQFLSEGFKPNQLLEEDWEELVKELTQAYIDGKVTEKQISNKLSRAGMGMLAKKRAHDIALANENKRNIKLQTQKNAEQKLLKATTVKPNTEWRGRGFAAAKYNEEHLRKALAKLGKKYPDMKFAGLKEELEKMFSKNENLISEEELFNAVENIVEKKSKKSFFNY